MASSPESARTWNSWDVAPPMLPLSARTARNSRPMRVKMRVRLGHEAIALGKAGFVHVKGVRILHQELAGAHDAEARPDFIAELGLYLIEIDRQLLVTA